MAGLSIYIQYSELSIFMFQKVITARAPANPMNFQQIMFHQNKFQQNGCCFSKSCFMMQLIKCGRKQNMMTPTHQHQHQQLLGLMQSNHTGRLPRHIREQYHRLQSAD
jgi:hypothetical protein